MEPVKVYARIKPHPDGTGCATVNGKTVTVERTSFDKPAFTYDGILDGQASQDDVYDAAAAYQVKACLDGYCSTIVCYGQTGTGKTYTFNGILSRCIGELFEGCGAGGRIHVVGVHIYKEVMTDTATGEVVTVQKGKIHGAKWVEARTETEAFEYIKASNDTRVVSSTKMNHNSSRSHAAILFKVLSPTGAEGKLSVVDLAGSERFNKTQPDTTTKLDEAKFINKSLMCLGTVVSSLAARLPHVPFRESILTRFLEDSLTGKGKATIIITLSADPGNVAETVATCQFGSRAMRVTTTPAKTDSTASWGVSEWRAKCGELEAQLGKVQTGVDYTKAIADLFNLRTENSRLQSEVEDLRKAATRAATHSATESHLSQAVRRIETLNKKILEFRSQITEQQEALAKHDADAKSRKTYVLELEKMVETLEAALEQKAAKPSTPERKAEIRLLEQALAVEKRSNAEKSDQVRRLQLEISEFEQRIAQKDAEIASLGSSRQRLSESRQIAALKDQLRAKNDELEGLEEEAREAINEKEAQAAALRKQLAVKDRQIQALTARNEGLSSEAHRLEAIVNEKDLLATTLQQQFNALAQDMTERELALAKDRGMFTAEREATQAVIDTFARKVQQKDKEIKSLEDRIHELEHARLQ